MISRRSLIFGISELIKVIPEQDVPPELYRLAYYLEHRERTEADYVETGVEGLQKILAAFDLPLVCPDCKSSLPQCEVCLYCGHYFEARQFDPRGPNILKTYKPFKAGSQREIVEQAIRIGTPVDEIVKQVRDKYPGIQDSTVVNNMYIYLSTWRKQFGWTIVRANGVIKLEDTHGNG